MKKVFTIEQFGGKGDGAFDNTNAFDTAFAQIAELNCEVELHLQPNSTYYFAGIGKDENSCALRFSHIKNLSIIGENTIILCADARSYMNVERCENLVVKGLIFDQKKRAHFKADIVEIDTEEHVAIVKIDRDIEMDDHFEIGGRYFGVHNTGGLNSRIYYYINCYDWVDKADRLLKVSFSKSDTRLNTSYNVKNRLFKGQSLILPTPNIGHAGDRAFTFRGNHNLSFIDCTIWNYPFFGVVLWMTSGTVLFKNFNVVPPIEEPVDFVGWRDVFHCKTNTAKIIWDGCTVKGANDDIINLSVNMLYVDKINSPTDIVCCWRETHGQYCPEYFDMTGCPVEIWNIDTGKIVSRNKIKEVVDYKTNHFILEKPINTDACGENVRLCVENHIAPGSEIINCNFKGTLRIKSNHTVKNSKLCLLRMWVDWEGYVEGPVPKNVLFENVDFYPNSPTEKIYCVSAHNKVFEMRNEETYHLENIVFKNCRGLHKENFYFESNFIEGSVDEIKIID